MVDQLPVWGFVGEARKEGREEAEVAYIYTHKVGRCAAACPYNMRATLQARRGHA
jgi:hypothetical protein